MDTEGGGAAETQFPGVGPPDTRSLEHAPVDFSLPMKSHGFPFSSRSDSQLTPSHLLEGFLWEEAM